MKFLDTLRLLLRLHALIQRKGTGTPEMLARRLDVSRSALFRYMKILESLDAPIAYCKYRQSYYYTETFELVFRHTHTHTHTHILTKINFFKKNIRVPIFGTDQAYHCSRSFS